MKHIRTSGPAALILVVSVALSVSVGRAQTTDRGGTTGRGMGSDATIPETGGTGDRIGEPRSGPGATGGVGTTGGPNNTNAIGTTGTVDSFSPETGVLRLKTADGRTQTFRVTPETTVRQGTQNAGLSDIDSGNTVTVFPNSAGTATKNELRRVDIHQ